MKRTLRLLFALTCLSALPLGGCATLDISHDAAVDFERYKIVSVDVTSNLGDEAGTTHLIEELNEVSGFRKAVRVGEKADLSLVVTVRVDAIRDSEGFLDYVAEAHYVVTTPDGEELLDDYVSDTSSLPSEAVEDALDEVARVFIPAYDY